MQAGLRSPARKHSRSRPLMRGEEDPARHHGPQTREGTEIATRFVTYPESWALLGRSLHSLHSEDGPSQITHEYRRKCYSCASPLSTRLELSRPRARVRVPSSPPFIAKE